MFLENCNRLTLGDNVWVVCCNLLDLGDRMETIISPDLYGFMEVSFLDGGATLRFLLSVSLLLSALIVWLSGGVL